MRKMAFFQSFPSFFPERSLGSLEGIGYIIRGGNQVKVFSRGDVMQTVRCGVSVLAAQASPNQADFVFSVDKCQRAPKLGHFEGASKIGHPEEKSSACILPQTQRWENKYGEPAQHGHNRRDPYATSA